MSKINDKVALVTGGTRGIGFAIARALLARGAKVFLCGTTVPGVDEAITALRRVQDSRPRGMVCDVRNYEQVRGLLRETEQSFGGLDILINNAGVGLFRNVQELTPEEWRTMIETNLSGVFYCCREAIPLLKRRGGGYIINIGSLAGKNAFPGGAAYNATKFGLIGFSEALMQEVRYDHIRVSCVMPGSVDTKFGDSAGKESSSSWKLQPDDVAGAVMNLLEMDPRALASRLELRPSEPRK
ncbi:MAG: SDR family oxidoreductase [Acidobacteriota bacterium]|jgi:NAD(P)-dependent dehydrogenase (short-subunit alcohol dehydrogenase family)